MCFTTEQQKSYVVCAHTHTALTTASVGSLQATLPHVYDQHHQSALNGHLSLLQNLEHLVDVKVVSGWHAFVSTAHPRDVLCG